MGFRYRGFSAHNHLYHTPSASSSSNYTNFSEDLYGVSRGVLSGRSVGGGHGESEILRELEKKRIREEILAEEAAAAYNRVLESQIRREYLMEREMRGFPSSSSSMLGHPESHHHHQFQPRLHGQSYEPVDRRIALPVQEDYGGRQPAGELVSLMDRRTSMAFQDHHGGGGRQPGEPVALDVVPYQRHRKIKEIITSQPKAGNTGFIGIGTPSVPTVSGAKRKQPPPPPSPAAGGSTEICSISKKKLEEWSCAICEVSTTSERGLQEHLAGKKHQAKMADLKADPTGKIKKPEMKKSPESVQVDSNEDKKKDEGESSKQKFKFWCRMCKTGASDKKEMNMHKKGIRHLKNQLNRAQKFHRKAGNKV